MHAAADADYNHDEDEDEDDNEDEDEDEEDDEDDILWRNLDWFVLLDVIKPKLIKFIPSICFISYFWMLFIIVLFLQKNNFYYCNVFKRYMKVLVQYRCNIWQIWIWMIPFVPVQLLCG